MDGEKTHPKEIKARIEALRKQLSSSKTKAADASGFALSVMIVSDLAGGLLVGAGIGYVLCALFDAHPAVWAVFILLGGFAGLLNVFKSVSRIEKEKKQ